MIETVTKFKAEDGAEFHFEKEAEAHNFFLKVHKILHRVSSPKYSSWYDGPMPTTQPTLRTMCYHKEAVRHLFLDVDPPKPEIETIVDHQVEYAFPHWSVPLIILLIGIAIGWYS